jgi:hypothetical protein
MLSIRWITDHDDPGFTECRGTRLLGHELPGTAPGVQDPEEVWVTLQGGP